MKHLRALRENGHPARGEAPQGARPSAAPWLPNGRLSVTDGPYAETKEVLGGLFVREAEAAGHAVAKSPGPFELRPIDEEFTAGLGAGNR